MAEALKPEEEEIGRLTKIIEENPKDAEAYFNRGNAYFKLDENEKAIQDYTRAIELDPENVKAYYNRGLVLSAQERYEKAIKDFTKAIELDPNSTDAYNIRGYIWGTLMRHEEAIKDYTRAIELDPKNVDAYNNKGRTFAVQERYKEAIENFNKAIEIDPNCTRAYYNRGSALDDLERYEEAIRDCSKAIELDPNCTKAYNNRGLVLYNKERYKEAIQDYTKAIELDPTYSEAYCNRGNTFGSLYLYDKAIEDYNKAIEIDPNNTSAYYNRGVTFSILKRYEEAINDYTKAIENDPKNVDAYNNRGVTFFTLKRYKEAIQDYNKAIEIDPNYSLAYNNRGELYLFQEEWENAAQSFNAANEEILDILSSYGETEQIEEVIKFMIVYDDFFNKTTNSEAISTENKELYKKIYISALQVIASLHVKKESTAAHYTKRVTAAALLFFKDSKFRLNSTITANDPQEGETLLKYFKLEEPEKNKNKESQNEVIMHDYQAFIGCFTFNHESLNQFRLYGKESDKEATGISLVLKKDFFNEKMNIGLLSNCFLKDNDKENANVKDERTQKYALYRCIYVDPETHKVISLGHKEEYSFYRENFGVSSDEISIYNKEINKIKSEVANQLNKLDKSIKTGKDLDKNIICELLLPLRFLVKHVAYKEEQECRIFDIKDLKDKSNEIKFASDYAQMYIDYQPITDHVKKVIFAPKTEGVEIFKKATEQEGLDIECEISTHPFS